MNEQLPAFKIKKGRRIFDVFNILNSFSFALVTGNTITLYALFLHANSTIVGLLMACMYLSFFAIPLGKLMIKRFTIMQTFGYAWFFRTFSLAPMLFIPVLFAKGYLQASLYCLLASVGLFNFFRGIGMISNNPVIQILAPGKDRGSFIVRISLFTNVAALFANGMLAVLLWISPSIAVYHLVIIIGIVFGFAASALVFKIPEPTARVNNPTDARPKQNPSFFAHVRTAYKDTNFCRFTAAFFILSLGVSMTRPFIIVYAKEVYGQNDSIITVLTLFSLTGALFVGLIMQLVIDRIGAKPMYIIFMVMSAASLIPALFAPFVLKGGVIALIFLILLSVVSNMGFVGQDNASQAYFFSMVSEDALMDLSMLYFFILGITGGVGSIAGGMLLDFFRLYGLTPLQSYRIFFIAVIALIGLGVFFQVRLLALGSYEVSKTLGVLFSPRDMRALNLLHKLDTHKNLETEQKVLNALAVIASSVSSDQLAHYIESPRLSIRLRALQALYSLSHINVKATDVLLKELKTGYFSTAPLAAKVCGKFKVTPAIPLLRNALESDDYYFTGEAMIALASMNDTASLIQIGTLISKAENHALLLNGIQALELYGSETAIPFIIDILRRDNLPEMIENETILAAASVMHIQNDFYYTFEQYKNEAQPPEILVLEALDECFAGRKKTDSELKNIINGFMESPDYDEKFIDWIVNFSPNPLGLKAAFLLGTALDSDLIKHESFRLFLSVWAICVFKNPKLLV